jgi:uncharacterized membrane protein YqjE
MGEIAHAGQGIFASLKGLIKTIIGIGQNRLELLLVELQEERWRLFEALVLAGLALVLVLMTLMVVTMTIVIVCIINHALWVVAVLAGIYLLGTLICVWQLRNRLKNWAPFAATLAEIKKDKACLEGTK